MSLLSRYTSGIANKLLAMVDARVVMGEVTRPHRDAHHAAILHQKVFPWATYSPWLSDEEFIGCYEQVKANTLVDVYRCYELWRLARQLSSTPGDYLEVGVWRGGTGCLIASAVRGLPKTVYLADTFSGVVKAGEKDSVYTGGEHSDTSEEIVLQLRERLSLGNVRILKGVFPEETGREIAGPIALLHCDVDVYSSAKDIVDWAMPRLSRSGVLVFDDYGFETCAGVTSYVNELAEDDRLLFVHNLNGHGILIRK